MSDCLCSDPTAPGHKHNRCAYDGGPRHIKSGEGSLVAYRVEVDGETLIFLPEDVTLIYNVPPRRLSTSEGSEE